MAFDESSATYFKADGTPYKPKFDESTARPYTLEDEAREKGVNLDTQAPVGSHGFFGGLADIGRGLAHGTISGLPTQVGQAAQFFGLPEVGKQLTEFGKAQDEAHPELRQSQIGQIANADTLSLRGGAYGGGENTPLSAGPGLAGAAVGAGLGAVGGPVGALGGAAAGYIVGSLGALPIFYGSQGQQSYEAIKKGLLQSGVPEDQAEAQARTGGHAAGAIEAGGELASDVIPFSALAKPFAKPLTGQLVKSMLREGGWRKALATIGKVEAGEVGTEMAQQAGEAQVEKAFGSGGEGATWKDTLSVVVPTALMSLLPGGFTALHNFRNEKAINRILADGEANPEARNAAAQVVVKHVAAHDQDVAHGFDLYAADKIEAGQPIDLQNDAVYLQRLAQDIRERAERERQDQERMGALGIDPQGGPAQAAAAAAVRSGATDTATAQREAPLEQAAATANEEKVRAENPGLSEAELAERLQRTIQAEDERQQKAAGERREGTEGETTPTAGARPLVPFDSPDAALAAAKTNGSRTGEKWVVIPHPTKKDAYTAVPESEARFHTEPMGGKVTQMPEPSEQRPKTATEESPGTQAGKAGAEPAIPRVDVGEKDSWLNTNAQAARDHSDRLGLTAEIERRFADGLTVAQVQTALKDKLTAVPMEDRSSFIVQVRATLGIPSRQTEDGKAEFDAWKADYSRRNAATTETPDAVQKPEAESVLQRPGEPGEADAERGGRERVEPSQQGHEARAAPAEGQAGGQDAVARERPPLPAEHAEHPVKVKVLEFGTGKTVETDMKAGAAVKMLDDRIDLAGRLMECLQA